MWSKFPLQQLQKKSKRLRHSQMDLPEQLHMLELFPYSAETPWKQNSLPWESWCQSSPKAAGSMEQSKSSGEWLGKKGKISSCSVCVHFLEERLLLS